jgi:hypothetical protein
MITLEDPISYFMFEGITGLLKNLYGKSETLYTIDTPPPVLSKKDMHPDTRLTFLEGEVGLDLAKAGVDVSLIGQPHGICPERNENGPNNYYWIGLCSPACTKYDIRMFESYMRY